MFEWVRIARGGSEEGLLVNETHAAEVAGGVVLREVCERVTREDAEVRVAVAMVFIPGVALQEWADDTDPSGVIHTVGYELVAAENKP